MDIIGPSNMVFSLRDLLTSTLVATIDADTATSRRYFNNMCEIAFEKYNPQTNDAENLRTLNFHYSTNDGTSHTLSVPVLSLVPLPLLQVQDADFSFDVQIMGMFEESEEETLSLTEETQDNESSSSKAPAQLMVALQPISVEKIKNMVSSGAILPNMKVNIRLNQADMPGGLSRMLNIVNNMD